MRIFGYGWYFPTNFASHLLVAAELAAANSSEATAWRDMAKQQVYYLLGANPQARGAACLSAGGERDGARKGRVRLHGGGRPLDGMTAGIDYRTVRRPDDPLCRFRKHTHGNVRRCNGPPSPAGSPCRTRAGGVRPCSGCLRCSQRHLPPLVTGDALTPLYRPPYFTQGFSLIAGIGARRFRNVVDQESLYDDLVGARTASGCRT
jgi:hypothetical protein